MYQILDYFLVYSIDHLELYIKVRLNTRPSYQRQQRFGRGPVVHKTRVLRGSRNPQWKEDFMVCVCLLYSCTEIRVIIYNYFVYITQKHNAGPKNLQKTQNLPIAIILIGPNNVIM